jgi:hypothetical protein
MVKVRLLPSGLRVGTIFGIENWLLVVVLAITIFSRRMQHILLFFADDRVPHIVILDIDP